MSRTELTALVAGGFCVGYGVIAAHFLRFWRRTADGLFLAFALAFLLLALGQLAAGVLGAAREDYAGIYLFRLVAFGLILSAILSKNLRGR